LEIALSNGVSNAKIAHRTFRHWVPNEALETLECGTTMGVGTSTWNLEVKHLSTYRP
jgi:hypothetical protein